MAGANSKNFRLLREAAFNKLRKNAFSGLRRKSITRSFSNFKYNFYSEKRDRSFSLRFVSRVFTLFESAVCQFPTRLRQHSLWKCKELLVFVIWYKFCLYCLKNMLPNNTRLTSNITVDYWFVFSFPFETVLGIKLFSVLTEDLFTPGNILRENVKDYRLFFQFDFWDRYKNIGVRSSVCCFHQRIQSNFSLYSHWNCT